MMLTRETVRWRLDSYNGRLDRLSRSAAPELMPPGDAEELDPSGVMNR